MSRNIIICSDGTGNTFDRRVTNVTHLIKALALADHTHQVVLYDQGVGQMRTAPRLSTRTGAASVIRPRSTCCLRPSDRRSGQRRGWTVGVDS